MKASDIRDWDDVEIRARLGELREEKFRLRFRMGTMQLENPKMVQHIRRDVARLNTILRERELSEGAEMADETPETTTDEAPEKTTDETSETVDKASETVDETSETADKASETAE